MALDDAGEWRGPFAEPFRFERIWLREIDRIRQELKTGPLAGPALDDECPDRDDDLLSAGQLLPPGSMPPWEGTNAHLA